MSGFDDDEGSESGILPRFWYGHRGEYHWHRSLYAAGNVLDEGDFYEQDSFWEGYGELDCFYVEFHD